MFTLSKMQNINSAEMIVTHQFLISISIKHNRKFVVFSNAEVPFK